MKINEIYPANKELTPEEIWLLTSDSGAVPIKKTIEVETIEIETAVFYDDVSEKTGEVKEILCTRRTAPISSATFERWSSCSRR